MTVGDRSPHEDDERPVDNPDTSRAGPPAAAGGRDVPPRAPSPPDRDALPQRDHEATEQPSGQPGDLLPRAGGAPLRVDDADQGGETACWMPLVCTECGRMADADPPTRCARCGALIEAD